MKNTKYALALVIGLVSLFASAPLLADQTVEVTITDLTFNGLNACPPAPVCSESLTASFQWDNSTNTYVNGTATGSASGALGSMSVFETPLLVLQTTQTVEIAFADGSNDTIIVDMGETGGVLTEGAYPLISTLGPPGGFAVGALICGFGNPPTADTCSTTDYPQAFFVNGFPAEGAFATSGTVSVSGVPEPSSLLLIGTGLVGLGAIRRKRLHRGERKMPKFLWIIRILLLIVAVGAATNLRADTTYTVNETVGGGSATGFITTDGTIGTLGTANILDWNLVLNDGTNPTFDLLGPLEGGSNSGVFISGSDVTATSTQLSFNFSGTDFPGYLIFQNPFAPSSDGPFLCFVDAEQECTIGQDALSSVSLSTMPAVTASFPDVQFTPLTGTQVIAGGGVTTTPEPSSLILLGTGLLGLIGAARRKRLA